MAVDPEKKAKAIRVVDAIVAKALPDIDLAKIQKARAKLPKLTRFDPNAAKSGRL